MADRDDIYKKFGPKLLEAIVESLREEIDEVRQVASLPKIDKADADTKVKDKLASTTNYDWMTSVAQSVQPN